MISRRILRLNDPNFPFAPRKSPAFYGWVVVFACTIGRLASIPGQTMGVGVFSEYLISGTGLSRIELSLAYMTGTILSSLTLPFAGKLYDRLGARVMIVATGIGLGVALLLFAQAIILINSLHPLLPKFLPASMAGLAVMTFVFLLLRQFGQGIMAMVSRNTMAKWFDTKRGLVTGISGIFASFGFSGAPLAMNGLINHFGNVETILLMSVVCGFGMALLGWLLFRDRPEECGLLMDGRTKVIASEHATTPEREVTLAEARRTYNFWIFCLGICSSSLIVTGFTFHIGSIGLTSGLSRMDAYAIFLPMSAVSVISHFVAGWASDRMPLKYPLRTTGIWEFLATNACHRLFWHPGWCVGMLVCGGVAPLFRTQAFGRHQRIVHELSGVCKRDWPNSLWCLQTLHWKLPRRCMGCCRTESTPVVWRYAGQESLPPRLKHSKVTPSLQNARRV